MIPQKPYALSCDKNSEPILQVLKDFLPEKKSLLEVGAGTGQHAIHMAPHFPNLQWTLADVGDRHEGIGLWLKDFPRVNLKGPIEYEIGTTDFPQGDWDVVFTANTLHIISWALCLRFFDDLGRGLKKNSLFIVYGAFNYQGQFTSASNEKFEAWLKEKDPNSGIRDFEKVTHELKKRGLALLEDREMPANNRMLIFKKEI